MKAYVAVISGPTGKLWSDTAAMSRDEDKAIRRAKLLFLRSWLTGWKVETSDTWQMWSMADRSGFKMEILIVDTKAEVED